MPATGPAIGGQCSVCRHPQVAVIDDLLRARKRSWRNLAAAFGLGDKAIGRHFRAHVGGLDVPRQAQNAPGRLPAAEASTSQPGASDDPTADPADVLRRQLTYLDGLDLSDLSPAQRVDILESRRRTADSLSRVEPSSSNLAVRVVDVDGLGELIGDLHELMKDCPGAREKLRDIWRSRAGVDLETA
jgi:hypothetical protein